MLRVPEGLVVLLAALVQAACQSAPTSRSTDAARDQPRFDVPPLDGATAGYALKFDGARSYATAGDAGFAPVGGAQAIELWVRYPSLPAGTQDFVALRTYLANGTQSGVHLGFHAGALAAWRVYVDRVLVQAPVVPAAGLWHHVAYTSDGTTNSLYVDGALADSQVSDTDTHTPSSVWLGTVDGSTNLFAGELDEVRIWAVNRSASQVAADLRHSSGSDSGLVAYWTFDDAGDTGRAVDLSGHGNDVTFGDGVGSLMPLRVPSDVPFPP